MPSFNYFEEKPTVKKRQPHKRRPEKVIKQDSMKVIFEKFIEFKIAQNLRPPSLNKFIVLFKSLEAFHETRSKQPLYVESITTDFISDYVYWLKNECVKFENNNHVPDRMKTVGLADSSISTRIRSLKTFINWCVKKDLLQRNPFDRYEGFKQNAHEIDVLTRSELSNLLKVTKAHSKKSFKHFRDYVLLHLLIDGMLRITEALLLSPEDIDHVNRTILIRSANAKSRKSRLIPLSNKTYRLLNQLLQENEAFEGETEHLVFLSLSGRLLDKHNVLRDFKKYAKEAGIKKRFYLHLIRHSVATEFLRSSGDIESLRKILGHADYRTIQIYVHLADSTVQEKHANHGFFGNENVTGRKRNNRRN
ncbi:tyrosine-type recombinase/integrase [Priestia megaterium]|uniref:tyrosine-type recombinase/integrase n=1 Tax=Priestia megaterium TaxID=1404 RepID=UPI003670DE3A